MDENSLKDAMFCDDQGISEFVPAEKISLLTSEKKLDELLKTISKCADQIYK